MVLTILAALTVAAAITVTVKYRRPAPVSHEEE